MIEINTGDIFETLCEAIVNPVNCKGVMGAGLAKKVKENFPNRSLDYERACKAGELKPGGVILDLTDRNPSVKLRQDYIIHLATKDHWRDPSRIEWIEEGIDNLVKLVNERRLSSVAIPALGAGLGGLEWEEVKRVMLDGLSKGANSRAVFEIYAPI